MQYLLRKVEGFPDPTGDTWSAEAAPAPEIYDLPGPENVHGVTYASHHITLYVYTQGAPKKGYQSPRDGTGINNLVMRMHHGGGCEYYEIDARLLKATINDLLALPPLALYAVLHSLYYAQRDAAALAAQDALHEFKVAFINGQLKKTRRDGRFFVSIEIPLVDPPKVGGEVISRMI